MSLDKVIGLGDKPFVNRVEEIARLDAFCEQPGAQFMVVCGRRRIGKTTLLSYWLHGRPRKQIRGFYWVAHRSTPEILLRGFSDALASCLGSDMIGKLSFSSWEDAFLQMFALARKEPLVAGIDELPYLLESVPGLASLLQKIWDSQKRGSQLKLILCGSQYHMMQQELFHPKRPLYGRSTASMVIDEIAPTHLGAFLPHYSPVQIVETYSVTGGVPKYLELWDDSKTVLHNIRHVVLSPDKMFRGEAVFLIQDEIPEARTYFAILEALGCGLKTPVTLGRITGLPVTHIGKYLHHLLELRIVRRVHSTEAPNEAQTRLTRYEIRDPYLRFHFEFVHPHPSWVEQNMMEKLMEQITPRFDAFVGKTGYEELARAHLNHLADAGKLPLKPKLIGRAWNTNSEVDLCGLDRKATTALFGECRWNSRKMDSTVLSELKAKADTFPRLRKWKKRFVLFSRSGFTADLTKLAKEEGVMLFDGPLLELKKASSLRR
jgi:uncharacterized protein